MITLHSCFWLDCKEFLVSIIYVVEKVEQILWTAEFTSLVAQVEFTDINFEELLVDMRFIKIDEDGHCWCLLLNCVPIYIVEPCMFFECLEVMDAITNVTIEETLQEWHHLLIQFLREWDVFVLYLLEYFFCVLWVVGWQSKEEFIK